MRDVKRALGYLLCLCDTKEKGVLGTVKLSPAVARWQWDRRGGVEASRISIPHAPPSSPGKHVGNIGVLNGKQNFRTSLQTPLNQILPSLHFFFVKILEWSQFQTLSLPSALLFLPNYRLGSFLQSGIGTWTNHLAFLSLRYPTF